MRTMTDAERDELFSVFLAALRAVVPEVTSDQMQLVADVVDGMVRERAASAGDRF